MKYTNFLAFEKHLQGSAPDKFAPIYVILGEDPFERSLAVSAVMGALGKREAQEVAVQKLESKRIGADLLLEELSTPSLFSENKIISIQEGELLKKNLQQVITNYLKNIHPTLTLVITATKLDQKTTFYKSLEKEGVIFDLTGEKAWEKEARLLNWVIEELGRRGKQASRAVAQLLVNQVGFSPSLLKQELDKLLCFLGDRQEVKVSDVYSIISSVNLEDAWKLGEAIFTKATALALTIGRNLLNEGNDIFMIISQIRSQFKTSCQVASLLQAGEGEKEISSLFPYMRGRFLEKHINLASTYGLPAFLRGMTLLSEAEMQLKSQNPDPYILLEVLLINLCLKKETQ